jgi:hypothetical protein
MFPLTTPIFSREAPPDTMAHRRRDPPGLTACLRDAIKTNTNGGAVAQLAARLDGIEEVGGSNPPGSTNPARPGETGTAQANMSFYLYIL